ncbi:hypothetical protein R2217_000791 [Cronobacter turicensis]|nr:hypothetical protein [Cronobacter turicensis]ELQ6074680.1 hypothetical protein [Cronobacter turicensis]ELQ6183734.1 hypothetical protein [Cronobacter turicensis]ELQ6234680.1 hypothetical protein [Cronobacter turicensis]ELQ6238560.1 hypothetical protein [Cronobacter turicensis]
MSEISKVIASEIADFFAGFGGPGEPDVQSGEAQRLLTERVLSVLALRERAEPFVYMNRFTGRTFELEQQPGADKDPAVYLPLYTAPPALVVPTFEEWCQRNGQKPVGWVREAMKEAYDGCRSAMLQPVSAPYKLPEKEG